MENTQTNSLTDGITYTISKNNGKFNSTRFLLDICMPSSAFTVIAAYDISKTVDEKVTNGIIIYIKDNDASGSKLPYMSSGNLPLTINTATINHTVSNELETTNPDNDKCIVIIFHDYPVTTAGMEAEAQKHYNSIQNYSVTEDTPYSNNDDKGKDTPKKLGMSLIKKG